MRLPTEKAYGVQMAHTCNALALEGVEVTLLTAEHQNSVTSSFFDYYQIDPKRITLVLLQIPQWFKNTRVGFWLHMLLFSLSALYTMSGKGFTVMYSREPLPLLFLSFTRKTTVYEMHDFPQSHHSFNAWLCRRVSKLVVTNAWAKEQCIKNYAILAAKILVTPNGYDETLYHDKISTAEARAKVDLPVSATIVMYSGHLYTWKGIDTILQLASRMPDITFVFVGGDTETQNELKLRYQAPLNVRFIPHQPPHLVPVYLQAADVLVIPNIPINQHAEFSTSPIKLFEYMAAGRPVIASKLPSLTSLVSEREVFFAKAGDVEDWQSTVGRVVTSGELVTTKVQAALDLAADFTWKAKAQKVINHITV